MRPSRRQLLQGAGAAALLAELGWIRERAFASADTSSSPDGMPGRDRYGLEPGLTYLNHASVGTAPIAVQRAHAGYLELCETNPWLYMWSEPWSEPRETVRARSAALLGCSKEEVAITHNTTECFNLLAQGLPLGPGDEVLFSSLNHSGASVCWSHHAAAKGYSVRRFDFDLTRIATLDADEIVARYERAIGPKTRILVLPHVDNQVGLRHPVAAIAAMARERGVRWIAVDGAQTAGMLPVDVRALEADIFATSCHKWLQSPKGLGLAYVRRDVQRDLRPMWVTWGQERWRGDARVFEDYGTRALPAVIALGDALAFQSAIGDSRRTDRLRALRETLRDLVAERPGLTWRSPTGWTLGASLAAVEVRGRSSTEVAARLFDEHAIVVRPFALPGLNALRISPNLTNDAGDLERCLDAALA